MEEHTARRVAIKSHGLQRRVTMREEIKKNEVRPHQNSYSNVTVNPNQIVLKNATTVNPLINRLLAFDK